VEWGVGAGRAQVQVKESGEQEVFRIKRGKTEKQSEELSYI
jgi:hypothetical protein